MRFAVLADIHGNALALEAVFADIDRQGITQCVHLGDYFSGPLDSARTAALLAARPASPIGETGVLGNHDRYLISQRRRDMGPSDQVAYDQLTPDTLDWLKTLVPTRMLWGQVYVCHGTPRSDESYWREEVDPGGQVRPAAREAMDNELDDLSRFAKLILCGHSHGAGMSVLSNGALLVNPGSVGCPAYDHDQPYPHLIQTGTPHARYAVVEKREAGFDVRLHAIAYDHHQAAAQARAHGREDWAKALESGWL